jgi:hypothetical protein
MRRRISSLYTWPMKMLPAPFLGLVTILMSVGFYFDPTEFVPDGAIGLSMLVAATALFAWQSMRMKFVSIDSDNLYVTGYSKTAVITLATVNYVYYSYYPGLVIIQLKSPSPFGETIVFMPTWGNGVLAALGSRSIVEELREMARDAALRSSKAG